LAGVPRWWRQLGLDSGVGSDLALGLGSHALISIGSQHGP
jgi:hypothetical protein